MVCNMKYKRQKTWPTSLATCTQSIYLGVLWEEKYQHHSISLLLFSVFMQLRCMFEITSNMGFLYSLINLHVPIFLVSFAKEAHKLVMKMLILFWDVYIFYILYRLQVRAGAYILWSRIKEKRGCMVKELISNLPLHTCIYFGQYLTYIKWICGK